MRRISESLIPRKVNLTAGRNSRVVLRQGTTAVVLYHELINYIDTKAKCRHLNKFTCKGTLRQVFICRENILFCEYFRENVMGKVHKSF
jgi:hypothetical protein